MTPIHNEPGIADFVAARVGGGGAYGSCATMGWEQDGKYAGVVFHNWQSDSGTIEISAVSDLPAFWTPRYLAQIMAYPFDQLGCRMVLARHSEHNRRVRRFWAAVGATEYILPDLRADGEAECLAALHRDVWRASKFNRSA